MALQDSKPHVSTILCTSKPETGGRGAGADGAGQRDSGTTEQRGGYVPIEVLP